MVIVNSLVKEQPHDTRLRPARPPEWQTYIKPNGLITMCSHCRRVERADEPEVWDWVPAWVEHMPDETSHSLCRPCLDYYYKFHA